ncbi:hypothetical protein [Dyadobacter sp. 3J3]|uniref:hypothetical protein n=1 Tax=Dyadobacter sp. 3J3 TaxID=2606600 RepID=UPI00135C3048|nr:hypothetical protein [Dyadobacter sp. 3J3]
MKRLTGIIILLLVQSLSFGQVNVHISNGGRAATQEWVKVYLETLLNRIEAPVDTGGVTTPPSPICSGPNIQSVSSTSPTGLTFTWSGLNVPDIVWTVSNSTGILRTGSVNSSNPTRSIIYNSIGYGTFSFSIKGIGCPTTPAPVSFTLEAPPVIVSSGRRIYMNTSGYGFSASDPYGIDQDWRKRIEAFTSLNYNGVTFSGINGVRLCMKWMDYEPSQGLYNDAKLIAAINYCKSKGLKLAICVFPLRIATDGFIPESERAKGSGGTIWITEIDKITLAPYSVIAKSKFRAMIKHLASIMAQYPNDTDYISMGYGNSEEFWNPIVQTYAPSAFSELTGYSDVDRSAWATYAAANGHAGLAPPVTPNIANAYDTGYFWTTENGKLWYDFITDGLVNLHATFRDAVHEGGVKACGFYADAGGAQSAWYMTYRLNKIFAGCDVMYSSEGANRYDLGTKLLSADVNLGTFPNAEAGIEFDPEDLSTDGSTNYGNNTDSGHLLEYGSSFFKRGGKIIHFALAYSFGENGTNNNIIQLAPALWVLQNDYVKSTTIPPITSVPTITFPITSFSGDQGYRSLWSSNGGGTDKQVRIKIE